MTPAEGHPDRAGPAGLAAAPEGRPRASGAGSPPSTTRRSASSTSAPRSVFFVRRRASRRCSSGSSSPARTAPSSPPRSTTRCSPCTAPRWCSSWACRWRSAFGNYFVPLQIGARDVAFPRLNMFGYWVVLFGGLFIYSGFLLGGAPNGGWFGYAPLTSSPHRQRRAARPRPRLLGRRHRSCSASGRRRRRSTSSSPSSTCARPA